MCKEINKEQRKRNRRAARRRGVSGTIQGTEGSEPPAEGNVPGESYRDIPVRVGPSASGHSCSKKDHEEGLGACPQASTPTKE